MTLPLKNSDPVGWVTWLAGTTSSFSCNQLAAFGKEMCEKLAKGSSVRQVNILPATTLLHLGFGCLWLWMARFEMSYN